MIPHEHISEKSLVAGLIVVAIAGLALASTGTSQLWNTSESTGTGTRATHASNNKGRSWRR
ncbi:MAG TPA: hypothetical protein VGW09_11010 [Nitrososphaeraceae archaeon]|nr:hypothetical protein [Nitrososphaeraceae archaeon]